MYVYYRSSPLIKQIETWQKVLRILRNYNYSELTIVNSKCHAPTQQLNLTM